MKDTMQISGWVKAWITDNKTGIKRLVFDNHNSVVAAYASMIVDALDTAVGFDYTLNNLFNGNTASSAALNGQDGIAIRDNGGLWYEMITTIPYVSQGAVLIRGTFTGVGITVANGIEVKLGHNWQHAGLDFNAGAELIVNPAGWVSQAVLAAETLTIDWVITHALV